MQILNLCSREDVNAFRIRDIFLSRDPRDGAYVDNGVLTLMRCSIWLRLSRSAR